MKTTAAPTRQRTTAFNKRAGSRGRFLPAVPAMQKKAILLKEKEIANKQDTSSTHDSACKCPGCTTSFSQVQLKTLQTLQSTGKAVVQTVCKHCGRKSGHKSDCPRNKNVMRSEAAEKKVEHEENSSWENIKHYRSGWVGRNGITEEDVNEFCRQYDKRKIRGHHSEDSSHKEHENTTTDLNAFKSWFTKKYGRWD